MIETERTRIVLLQPEQAHLLARYHLENRAHIEPWEPVRADDFYQLDTMRKLIARQRNDFLQNRAANFSALNPEGDRILASCSLHQIIGEPLHKAMLGYSVSADQEGTGLMFEVVQAVLDYAWKELRLHQLVASHAVDNHRSYRLLQRLGFREVGELPRYLRTARGWEDHLLHHKLNPLEAGNHGQPSLLGEDGD